MKPKVSIVVPVYNAARHLRQCLDSIVAQTERDLEIICVDDGSTDASCDIIEHFKERDARIKLLHTANGGGGKARNHGLAAASGEYIVFLDADDFFEPTYLEEVGLKLDNSGADMAVVASDTYDEQLKATYPDLWTFVRDNLPAKSPFSYLDMPTRIFNTFANVPWNKVFRTSFVREHGLAFQEIRRTNDLLFTCKALILAESIVTIDKVFVHYRVGHATNCQATNDADPAGFFKAFSALHSWLHDQGVYPLVEQSFVNHALSGYLGNLTSHKTFEGCKAVFDLCERYDQLFKITGREEDYYLFAWQINRFKQALDFDFEHFLFHLFSDKKRECDDNWFRGIVSEAVMRENLSERDARIARLEGVLQSITNSASFRLGRALTAPLRAARDGFQRGTRSSPGKGGN